jgi:hypothetical protein
VAIGIRPLAAFSGYPAAASFVTERDRDLVAGALEPSISRTVQGRRRRADRSLWRCGPTQRWWPHGKWTVDRVPVTPRSTGMQNPFLGREPGFE